MAGNLWEMVSWFETNNLDQTYVHVKGGSYLNSEHFTIDVSISAGSGNSRHIGS